MEVFFSVTILLHHYHTEFRSLLVSVGFLGVTSSYIQTASFNCFLLIDDKKMEIENVALTIKSVMNKTNDFQLPCITEVIPYREAGNRGVKVGA